LISLKRYLSGGREEGANSAIRAVSLLIQGIGLHALDQNKVDYEGLRGDLTILGDQLSPKTTEAELLVIVGEVIKNLEAYNRRGAGRLRGQLAELQGIIAALGGAMAKMVSASDTSLDKLRDIRTALAATEQIEDLRRLKVNLSQCLDGIGMEVEAHKKQSSTGMAALNDGVLEFEKRRSHLQEKPATDPVTGLQTRAEAENLLTEQASGNAPSVAVIFAVKRLKQVNTRFGYGAGDGLLERLATYLGSARPEDALYRWSGPALLSVIRRDMSFEKVRQDMRSLVAGIPEYEIRIGAARVAMVITAVGWAAFPVAIPVEKLVAQLDGFVNSQISD
jgi:GGDEF domain-containing protein